MRPRPVFRPLKPRSALPLPGPMWYAIIRLHDRRGATIARKGQGFGLTRVTRVADFRRVGFRVTHHFEITWIIAPDTGDTGNYLASRRDVPTCVHIHASCVTRLKYTSVTSVRDNKYIDFIALSDTKPDTGGFFTRVTPCPVPEKHSDFIALRDTGSEKGHF